MPTILQLQEKRTKLVHDAAAIMQAENVTAEQRAQVNTMLADEQVIVADIRAMEAIEASDKELRSTQRPHRGSPTGGQSEEEQRNAETRSAFEKFVRFGLGSMTGEERGLLRERRDITTTGANGNVAGNVIIPQLFDNVLNDAKKLVGNTVSVVRHKVTNNNGAPVKIGTANDTGNTLTTLTLEATEVSEQDPALGGFIGQTDTVTTLVKVSLQDLEDSAFDLDAWIKAKFGLRYYRGLEYMITNGNTSNVASVVAGATLGATTAANTGPVYDDFRAAFGALEPAYLPNGRWVMNNASRVWVMGLKDTLGRPIFIPNPNTGTLDYILGLPITLNQALPTATTAGATGVMLGDFEEGYILRTDGPLSIRRLEERYIDTLEIGFLAYARVGGYNVDAGTHPILKLTTHA